MCAWSTRVAMTVPMGHFGIFAYCMHIYDAASFCRHIVDVHRAVAALSRNEFVERVPCDSLNVVVVLSNLVHAFACNGCKRQQVD